MSLTTMMIYDDAGFRRIGKFSRTLLCVYIYIYIYLSVYLLSIYLIYIYNTIARRRVPICDIKPSHLLPVRWEGST